MKTADKTNIAVEKLAAGPGPAAHAVLVPETKDERLVRECGEAIIKKTGEVAGLYLSLCLTIRENSIAPATVSVTLKALGFAKSRVAEINRVANAPEDVFTNYQARAIGFNKALEFARVDKDGVHETPAAKLLAAGHPSPMSKDEIGEAVSDDDGKPSEDKKPASKAEKMNRAAAAIFKAATKPKVWKSGTGWQLVLSKCKVAPEPAKP